MTISATRRRELVREVPLAISSVAAERLAETGAKSLNDYLATQPGVVLQNSSTVDGAGYIIIRGLTVGVDSNSPTTVYVDDVPLGLGAPFDINLMDLNRLEVLRGPQGTLYGSSAMGGIVKYITNSPDSSEFSGKVGLGVSQTRHGGINSLADAVVNAPLKQDVAALRVAVFGSRDAGWVNATGPAGRNGVNSDNSHGGRVSLLVTPSRDFSATLTAMTQTRRSDGGDRLVYDPATKKPVAGDLVYPQLGFSEPRTNERQLYSLTLEYDLRWARLTSITSHQTVADRLTTDYSPLGIAFGGTGAYIDNDANNKKTTQEFRLVSQTAGAFQWLAGAFFDKLKLHTDEQDILIVGAPVTFNSSNADRDYKESAVYGNVTWNASTDLALTAGMRWARYKQEDTASTAATGSNSLTSDQTAKTYLLTAKYRLTPQSNVYARAANGYRPGGVNFSSVNTATGQPYPGAQLSYATDNAWTYEAGWKARFPDRASSLELALFDTEWKDLQQFSLPGGLATVGFTTNLGKARIRGIEATGSFEPVRDLTLGASLTLMDPKLLTDSPGLGGFAGDRLPNSPKTALALTSRYAFALGAYPAFAGLNVSYQGDRYSSFAKSTTSPNYVLPSFTQLDLSGGVKLGRFDLGLYVRNLTDERGQIGAVTNEQGTTGRTYVHVITPRTIGANLSVAF